MKQRLTRKALKVCEIVSKMRIRKDMRADEYKQYKKFTLACKKSEKCQKKPCKPDTRQQDIRKQQLKLNKENDFTVDFPDTDK